MGDSVKKKQVLALLEEFPIAKAEARVAFGNDELYIEKFIVEPRHIEFQVLADHHGNITHLGERAVSNGGSRN